MKKLTVAFDFDNVIHKYRKGWSDGSIYDELNQDMLKLIQKLLNEGHKVFILSTRSRFQIKRHFDNLNDSYDSVLERVYSGKDIIPFKYQTFWGRRKFWNKHGVCGICNHKAVFDVLIDDRAINFNPSDQITFSDIVKFKIKTYKS